MTREVHPGLRLAAEADACFAAGDRVQAEPLYAAAVEALTSVEGSAPKALARALIRHALCLRASGDPSRAAQALERAARSARAAGLSAHEAEASRLRAAVAEQRGDLETVDRWLRRALTAYTEGGSVKGAVATLNAMGRACRASGDLARACARFEQAQKIAAEAGYLEGRADALENLGNLFRVQADLEAAEAAFEAVLAVGEQTGDDALTARALSDLGNVAAARDQRARAMGLYERARAIQVAAGDACAAASNMCNMAGLWARSGRLKDASEAYREALADLTEVGGARVVIDVTLLLAQAVGKLGDLVESEQLLLQAAERAEAIDYVAGERRIAATLAGHELAAGRVDRSRERHVAAVAGVRDDGVPADEVAVLLGATDADLAAEEYGVASARMERAAHLVHTRDLVRYKALLAFAEASLEARRRGGAEAAFTLLTAADLLDSVDRPAEALAARLSAADFAPPEDPRELVKVAAQLGSAAAKWDAQSVLAVANREGPEAFEALISQARGCGMELVALAIERRCAELHCPERLDDLAAQAEACGASWQARLCREARSRA